MRERKIKRGKEIERDISQGKKREKKEANSVTLVFLFIYLWGAHLHIYQYIVTYTFL